MQKRPKAFLSYSNMDREVAIQLATGLRTKGIDVWYDRWEILPGDSLIKKIFEEGLSGADIFIVLISPESTKSAWVQYELDSAMIKRIEGVTRIIPVVMDGAVLPQSLKALHWIRLEGDIEFAIREIQKAVYQVNERPPLGEPSDFVKLARRSVGGLTPVATRLGLFLIQTGKEEIGNEESFHPAEIAEKLGLNPEEINDAIEELERLGLVQTRKYLGTHPYEYGELEATYALYLHFKNEGINYDPEEDIKSVASAIVAHKEISGKQITSITGLSPLRVNRAVSYLDDYGIIRVVKYMGTAPYNFGTAMSTGETRRFVAENNK